MFISKKIAVTAGILGSFALAGLGAGQALANGEAAKCVEDDNGNRRCVLVSEYKLTNEAGNVQIVNKQSQSCSGSGEMSCNSFVTLPAKKS
ncbi:hypothetical protein GCM10010415_49200 [Streptomyces atrovirens]|uniref:Uncharacterized protein n=1 Tax=Streptomyces atrovirens TaxID=285556 RepID=A0ABW0E4T3_9ACTN